MTQPTSVYLVVALVAMTMAATLTCASAAPGSDELLTAMTGAIPSAMDAASCT